MRYLKYIFLAALAVILIFVAVANRETVVLNSMPAAMTDAPMIGWMSYSLSLPLYVVIFLSIVAGLLIGFIWEWLREHKYRADAARKNAEVKQLERELRRTKAQRDKDKDDILALVDNTG